MSTPTPPQDRLAESERGENVCGWIGRVQARSYVEGGLIILLGLNAFHHPETIRIAEFYVVQPYPDPASVQTLH